MQEDDTGTPHTLQLDDNEVHILKHKNPVHHEAPLYTSRLRHADAAAYALSSDMRLADHVMLLLAGSPDYRVGEVWHVAQPKPCKCA